MNDEAPEIRHARAVEARGDLYYFSRLMFKLRKGFKWKQNWHHRLICDALMRVYRGECKRLIINIPPRYSKTELAVINFIAWCLGLHPDAEFIHTSYSGTLAGSNAGAAKQMVETVEYQDIFPDVQIRNDSKGKSDWRTTAGGVVYATGSGGQITGFGAGKMRAGFGGAIIIDDPHKADEANSDTIRGGVLDWFQNTLESRTNSPNTPIILIMQRLHENDLAGFLLGGGNGEAWEHLCIPVLNENDQPLWPFKHGIEEINRMRSANAYVFSGQYMQRPSPAGGGIFKTTWWRYYVALPTFRRIVQSWDTAFKASDGADFSVCTTWGETAEGYYLIDVYKQRVDFPDLKRAAINLRDQYQPHAVLIEDKASGQSLIQELQRGTNIPIVAIKVDADKVSRAYAVTPLIESGRVMLPEKSHWLLDYINSLAMFPNGTHDDDVDSTTQALNYLARGGGAMGLLDYYRNVAADEQDELRKFKEASYG